MAEFGERRGGFGRGKFGGRGRGRRDDFGEKPVNVGEEYDVEIESVAEKGDGVAKIKGLVVFVPGAQKGERLRIRIKELKRKCAIAEKIGAAGETAVEEATEDKLQESEEGGESPAAESYYSEEQGEEAEESEESEEEY